MLVDEHMYIRLLILKYNNDDNVDDDDDAEAMPFIPLSFRPAFTPCNAFVVFPVACCIHSIRYTPMLCVYDS